MNSLEQRSESQVPFRGRSWEEVVEYKEAFGKAMGAPSLVSVELIREDTPEGTVQKAALKIRMRAWRKEKSKLAQYLDERVPQSIPADIPILVPILVEEIPSNKQRQMEQDRIYHRDQPKELRFLSPRDASNIEELKKQCGERMIGGENDGVNLQLQFAQWLFRHGLIRP